MSNLKDQLLNSGKVKTSEEWDATYGELPVVIAEDANSLRQALEKLDTVGGYGYLAIWKKNLFMFNTCLLYTSPSPRDNLPSRMPSSA